MPYIKKEDRKVFDECLYELSNTIDNEGELNYCISTILHLYLEREGVRYAQINKLIGVLECAKMELYRQIAGPYESAKFIENGDISTLREKLIKKLIKKTVTGRSDGSKTSNSG